MGVAHPVTEAHDALGVDLAHPGLGDTEHISDLGEGEALEVVQGENETLAVRKTVDGVGENPPRLDEPGTRLRG